ncbi:two-component response regulator-like PRR95 isoform X2 [Cucurbita moschata]|uniref:Two-component response regulator-like PRR95 isoform X2 n=1 Tax=Cucurbita moschata TaxID=3662 RepID=A0A6J1EA49_CUCMO|nr:two-component response regulator-like PRR95 isoform X2 [Cucurbita moschata]
MDKVELSGVYDDAMDMDLDLDLDLVLDEDDRTKRKKIKNQTVDMEMKHIHHADEDGSHKLFPKQALSVLLVEADDSTRRIIAALLRKCSYRVYAVPDGLKAWECLKGRPHNVDLILTEVDLPSISGYALLTLVMEHDICKNIPVIMMSSCDAVSMVLKCMLKGAADFLIKPIRKNELKNLWQHVWRRHTISGKFPSYLTVGQREVVATSDNDEGSNYSSYCVASRKKIKECSEKGSDAQSSCTTPYLEAENRCMPNMQGLSPLKDGTAPKLNMSCKKRGFGAYMDKEFDILKTNIRDKSDNAAKSEACNSVPSRMKEDCVIAEIRSQNKVLRPDFYKVVDDGASEMFSYNNKDTEPSSRINDLIGNFDNNLKHINSICKFDEHQKCRLSSSNDASAIKLEFSPQLELSLRRISPAKPEGQWSENGHVLNHSNASAFSSYNSCKMMKPPSVTQPNAPTESDTSAGQSPRPLPSLLSGISGCTHQDHGVPVRNSRKNMTPKVAGGFDQAEHQILQPQLDLFPAPDLVSDKAPAGRVLHSMFYTPSVLPRVPNTRSTCEQEVSPISIDISFHNCRDISNARKVGHQYVENTDNTIERVAEELKHDSPSAATHSASSSLCNETDHINSNTNGSICNQTEGNTSSSVADDKTAASENMNASNVFTYEGSKGLDSSRSRHREAALEKFRLKRKGRCYEKKVRYQSRKRLAEQRPRVKGQFVRQRPSDPPASDSGCR